VIHIYNKSNSIFLYIEITKRGRLIPEYNPSVKNQEDEKEGIRAEEWPIRYEEKWGSG
jgi:hypothetical protein